MYGYLIGGCCCFAIGFITFVVLLWRLFSVDN